MIATPSRVALPLNLAMLIATTTLSLPLLHPPAHHSFHNLFTHDNTTSTTPMPFASTPTLPPLANAFRIPNPFPPINLPPLDPLTVTGMSTDPTSDPQLEDNSRPEPLTKPRKKAGHKPFFVQIEHQNYYGGLLTYSHPQHPARICRVMNACIRPDSTLVLPRWMKRHDNTLAFHCGHSNLEFSLPDKRPPPPLKRQDLVGLHCARPSMPHFLKDFIPNAVVFDLVYGDHDVTKSCHSRRGGDCDSFPSLMHDFKPVVMLHERLKSLDEKRSWVRQFVKMMKPPKSGLQPTIGYRSLSHDRGERMQCYRSAFFTRGPYSKNAIMADHLRDIHFLGANAIGKRERRVFQTSRAGGKERKMCHLNVTISNRQLVDGASNRLIGRYILNIPSLRKAIPRQAKRIRGLRLHVQTITMEGKTLRWQINAMQKTDIWVAGLGPLLTNMIFLRENSTVMELQPFAYYPKDYENMARYMAHVNYDRYIAHPDVEAFQTCVHQLYPKKHAARSKALDILEKYSMAAEKYAQSDSTHSFVLNRFNETSLRNIHVCARMQRLDTDSKKLAIAIVRHARLRCGLPQPKLRSNAISK